MGIAFANSLGIDSLGRVIQPDFRQFLSTRDKPIWNTSFSMPGPEFVSCYLSVENSIPNMSATVIRKKLLADALDRLESHLANMRMAGDWLVLAEILRESSISFTPHTLNACRKHDNSLTFKLDNWCHFKEVLAVKAHIMRDVPAARAHIVDSVGHAARLGTSLQLDEAKAAQLIRSAVGDGIIPPPDPFNAGGILS
jgi:hypothetical protein